MSYQVDVRISDNIGPYTIISGIGEEYDHKKIGKVLVRICKTKCRLRRKQSGTHILLQGDHSERVSELLKKWEF